MKACHGAFNYCNPPVVECKLTYEWELWYYYIGHFVIALNL